MENIGDYIYVLFFVGIIIFNLLRKAKQPPKPLPKPVKYEEEEKHNPFEEIFNDETPKQSEPVKAAFNPIVQPQVARKPAPKPAEPSIMSNLSTDDFQVINIDFSDTEQIRKGIVFAEIFNKKY